MNFQKALLRSKHFPTTDGPVIVSNSLVQILTVWNAIETREKHN